MPLSLRGFADDIAAKRREVNHAYYTHGFASTEYQQGFNELHGKNMTFMAERFRRDRGLPPDGKTPYDEPGALDRCGKVTLRYIPIAEYTIGVCSYGRTAPYKSVDVKARSLEKAMEEGRRLLKPSTLEHLCHVETRPNPEHVAYMQHMDQERAINRGVEDDTNEEDGTCCAPRYIGRPWV